MLLPDPQNLFPPFLFRRKQKTLSGGSGFVLSSDRMRYCLKCSKLLVNGEINSLFWNEAKGDSSYFARGGGFSNCLPCPIPVTFWLHRADPLWDSSPGPMAENCQRLDDFFSIFDIESQSSDLPDPEEYRKVPVMLLDRIMKEKSRADLVLAFPVQAAPFSLQDAIDEKKDFSEKDILHLTEQILGAILELNTRGLAHCDIKPSNIMVTLEDKKKEYVFDLTDFGSMSTENFNSESGTGIFFDSSAWNKLRFRDQFTAMDCRTLMDGYALAITLFSLAAGRIPHGTPLRIQLIQEKWPEQKLINKAFKTLYNVQDLTINKMRNLYGEFQRKRRFQKIFRKPASIRIYGREAEIPMQVLFTDKNGIEYGKFREQFSDSEEFSPVMRVECSRVHTLLKHRLDLRSSTAEFEEAENLLWNTQLNPIIINHKSCGQPTTMILPAPDDACTGKRVRDFSHYVPWSLAARKPEGEELKSLSKVLMRYAIIGKNIHGLLPFLPKAEDILRINGRWYIQWISVSSHEARTKIEDLPLKFSFQRYFESLYRA